MDSDAVTVTYGRLDRLLVSFTFYRPGCADSVDIIAKNSGADWPTPADVSASDAEFAIRLLPLDKSGARFIPLGMSCEPDVSPGRPENTSCGCERAIQKPVGPCHHAVTLSPLKDGDLKIDVLPLLNEEAN